MIAIIFLLSFRLSSLFFLFSFFISSSLPFIFCSILIPPSFLLLFHFLLPFFHFTSLFPSVPMFFLFILPFSPPPPPSSHPLTSYCVLPCFICLSPSLQREWRSNLRGRRRRRERWRTWSRQLPATISNSQLLPLPSLCLSPVSGCGEGGRGCVKCRMAATTARRIDSQYIC